jgi:hypothetical protein
MKVPCSVRREQIICNLQITLFKSETYKQSFYLKSICHRRLKSYEKKTYINCTGTYLVKDLIDILLILPNTLQQKPVLCFSILT